MRREGKAPLDLRAPNIARVIPKAELESVLPEPDEPHESSPGVEIKGKRPVAPSSVGLMALPWALRHPSQAWRIFLPIPSE